MQKLTIKKIKLHIDIERIPTITLYASLTIAIICLLGAAWFTYNNVYQPYMNNTIPEEKLTQKQDKLNVKDFDLVRTKLEAKQKELPNTVAIDPLKVRLP